MMQKKHLPWLDLIRFFASFLVVTVHLRCAFFDTYSELAAESQNLFTKCFFYLNNFGLHGVIIFFILSGFLVGGINIDRVLNCKSNLKLYIVDRSVRIMYPLLGALMLIAIVDAFDSTESHSFFDLLGNFFGLQGTFASDAGGVFWTLAYEIWFYVLIGGLIALFSCRNPRLKFIAIAVITVAVGIFSHLNTLWLIILSVGILTFYLSKFDIPYYKICGVFALITMALFPFTVSTKVIDRETIAFVSSTMLIVLFAFSCAIFISQIVRHNPNTITAIKFNNYGTKLASFSYSLYITHWQFARIMHLCGFERMHNVNAYNIIIFLLLIVASFVFAYVFYLIFECRTALIKNRVKQLLKI